MIMGPWNVKSVPRNVIMRLWNVIMGLRHVIMGQFNVNRDCGM